MAYAIVKNNEVVFVALDTGSIARYLHENEKINISLPENVQGLTFGIYQILPLVFVSDIPKGTIGIGIYKYVIAGNGNLVERHEETREITLQEYKNDKVKEIVSSRDYNRQKNVVVNGATWQADDNSQFQLNSAILLANNCNILPQVWRDANNNNVPITDISQLLEIASAIAQQTTRAYADSWNKKLLVQNATTVEEVLAIAV